MGEPVAPGPGKPTRRQRVQARVQTERERLEAARSTSVTVGFAFDAFSYDTDSGAPVLAAALGFRVFLFVVPYVCLALILGGYLSSVENRNPSAMFRGRGIAYLTAKSVAASTSLSEGARVITLLLVVYALYLAARSLVKVLYIVHALVWAVPRSKPKKPNRAALLLIAVVAVAAGLTAVIDRLRQVVPLGSGASLLLYTVLLTGTWWFVSAWLPHRDCPLIVFLPGAVVFALGTIVLELITILWLPHYLDGRSALYGTLGLSVTLLLWAYLLGRMMTLAAVLNASLWDHFGTESDHPVRFRRPTRRWPFIHDILGRLWIPLFGDDDGHPDTDGMSDQA
jgi:uncharacterized BrkB/YihY/UPF0761 family membrane protein